MTERAIDKMVKYAESWLDSGTEYSRGQIIEAMVNMARRLASEEAKEKPTANADLVGELGALIASAEWMEDGQSCCGKALYVDVIEDAISRYRPSTQADIVGELKKYKEGLCYQASCCGIGVPRELKTRIEELDRVIEIIRKHEGDK